jgi:hypothetical protein
MRLFDLCMGLEPDAIETILADPFDKAYADV